MDDKAIRSLPPAPSGLVRQDMDKETFDAIMREGLQQAQADRSEATREAFADLRNDAEIDKVAAAIMKKYRKAFEELAK